MTACIIRYNMIVEDGVDEKYFRYDDVGEKVTISHDDIPEFDEFI